jgi:hypothetical protein
MIEDSKVVSRSSKTKKEGQWNDQKKKYKQWHYTPNDRESKRDPPFLMHFSDLILLFRQLIIPLFLATVIVLLIYIINAYMNPDNACSELTSTNDWR